MAAIEQELRTFIIDNFLFGEDDGTLSGDDSFLEQGIIDSTGVLELVALLEKRYSITIKNDELEPENLDSIHKLVRFIDRKTQLSGMSQEISH